MAFNVEPEKTSINKVMGSLKLANYNVMYIPQPTPFIGTPESVEYFQLCLPTKAHSEKYLDFVIYHAKQHIETGNLHYYLGIFPLGPYIVIKSTFMRHCYDVYRRNEGLIKAEEYFASWYY